MTYEELNKLMAGTASAAATAAISQSKPSPSTQLTKPRVGGIDDIGAWTGFGADGNPTEPRTDDCYQQFDTSDKVKAFNALRTVKEKVKKGIVDHPCNTAKLLFSATHEEHGDKFVIVFRAAVQFIKESGCEGIFLIITRDHKKINMLETPGLVTPKITQEWIEDLTNKGVLKLPMDLSPRIHQIGDFMKSTLQIQDSMKSPIPKITRGESQRRAEGRPASRGQRPTSPCRRLRSSSKKTAATTR